MGREERAGVWGGGREEGAGRVEKRGAGRREIGKLSNVMSTQHVARLHNSQDHLVPQDRTMEVVMTRVP